MTATYEGLALRCWSAGCGLGVAELLDEIGAGSATRDRMVPTGQSQTSAASLAAGRTPAAGEAIHVLEVAGLGLLWRLATPAGGRHHPVPD